MFKQPSEVQRKVERIKLLNISLKPLVLSSRDSFNIPATSSLSSFRSAPAPATSSRSYSASSQQHTKGYHLVSTPHNSRNNSGSNSSSSSSSSRSRTLLYRLIVQTFLALFLVTKCCDAAKQDGKHAGYKYRCF